HPPPRVLNSFPTRRSSDLVQELDNRWRASLGAAPRDASTPSGATQPNPPAQPNQPAQPNPAPAAPFSCACLSGALFLSLWWFIQDRKSTRLNSSHVSTSYA